tara:strand:- start:883 stop:1320 length:438 start_codon:yes stop_codon:yes gene_type:complete
MKKIYKDIETAKKTYLGDKKYKLQKIHLSLVDDFNKKLEILKDFDKFYGSRIVKLRNTYLQASSIITDIKDLYQDSISDTKEAKELVNEIVEIVDKIAKATKEIGLDVNDVKGMNEVTKVVANIEDDIDTFEQTENDYEKIIKSI